MQRFLQTRCQLSMNQKLRIYLAMLLLVFASCKKEEAKQTTCLTGNSIIGKWELRKDYGAMLAAKFYDAGNGNIMQFGDSTYQVFANNQLQLSGTYKLIPDSTAVQNVCLVVAENFKQRIVFNGNLNGPKVFVNISGKKLGFLSGCFALDAGWGKDYEIVYK